MIICYHSFIVSQPKIESSNSNQTINFLPKTFLKLPSTLIIANLQKPVVSSRKASCVFVLAAFEIKGRIGRNTSGELFSFRSLTFVHQMSGLAFYSTIQVKNYRRIVLQLPPPLYFHKLPETKVFKENYPQEYLRIWGQKTAVLPTC